MTEFQVIDADGHLTDKDNAIAPYLDKPFRSRRRPFHIQDNWDRAMGGRLGASAPDPETWIKAMDKEGIDVAVLYPTAALGIGAVRKPVRARSLRPFYRGPHDLSSVWTDGPANKHFLQWCAGEVPSTTHCVSGSRLWMGSLLDGKAG